jgi:hypothetical protein
MTETASHFAAIRALGTALRHWHNGEHEKVNATVANMPQSLYVGASLTLADVALAALAADKDLDFDVLLESIVAELIGLESEESDDD